MRPPLHGMERRSDPGGMQIDLSWDQLLRPVARALVDGGPAAGQDALARAVFKAAVHHSRSSTSLPAGASSSASPASTSPPR